MLRGVVISNNSFHIERARQVTCQFWQHGPYKVEKVVFPCSIIRKTVTISLVTNQMRLINIVHTHIVKPFSYLREMSILDAVAGRRVVWDDFPAAAGGARCQSASDEISERTPINDNLDVVSVVRQV